MKSFGEGEVNVQAFLIWICDQLQAAVAFIPCSLYEDPRACLEAAEDRKSQTLQIQA
jgi:hypothetical protein